MHAYRMPRNRSIITFSNIIVFYEVYIFPCKDTQIPLIWCKYNDDFMPFLHFKHKKHVILHEIGYR